MCDISLLSRGCVFVQNDLRSIFALIARFFLFFVFFCCSHFVLILIPYCKPYYCKRLFFWCIFFFPRYPTSVSNANPDPAQCTMGGNTAVTVVDGTGTVAGANMVRPAAAPGYTVKMTVTGLAGTGSVIVNVVRGSPYALAADPPVVQLRTRTGAQLGSFSIAVVDAAGNPLDNADAQLTRVVTVTSAQAGLRLPGQSVTIAPPGRGRADYPLTTLLGPPSHGVFTATLGVAGLIAGTLTVNVTEGPIERIAPKVRSVTVNAGTRVSLPEVVVYGYDASGVRATLSGTGTENRTIVARVASVLGANGAVVSGSSTALAGETIVNMIGGVARFDALGLVGAAQGNVTLSFAELSGRTVSGGTVVVIVSAGLPVSLAVTNPPGTLQAVWPLTLPRLQVHGIDLNGAHSFAGEPGSRTLTATVLERPNQASSDRFEAQPAPIAVMTQGSAQFVGLKLARAHHGTWKIAISAPDGLNGAWFQSSTRGRG
jgi:hypothetical protein